MVGTLVNASRHHRCQRTCCGRRACDLNPWDMSIIGVAVQCPDGKYFGSIRAPGPVYNHVLEFLKRNHGRKLREVMDAEIDISDVIQ
jgi:hypothetical protein